MTPHACRPQPSGTPASRSPAPRSAAEPTVADAMLTAAKLCDPSATVEQVRSMFANEHLHAAVVVERGVLLCVIDLADLTDALDADTPVSRLGALSGRVISGDTPLDQAWRRMLDTNRRRLAVIDEAGTFRGLLCLKRSRAGFCSDSDVLERPAGSSLAVP